MMKQIKVNKFTETNETFFVTSEISNSIEK